MRLNFRSDIINDLYTFAINGWTLKQHISWGALSKQMESSSEFTRKRLVEMEGASPASFVSAKEWPLAGQ